MNPIIRDDYKQLEYDELLWARTRAWKIQNNNKENTVILTFTFDFYLISDCMNPIYWTFAFVNLIFF